MPLANSFPPGSGGDARCGSRYDSLSDNLPVMEFRRRKTLSVCLYAAVGS
ncbi:MAG: hypothetical protein ACLR9W_13295 [Enterobacter hormaechei]